jgi:hypothetical protein
MPLQTDFHERERHRGLAGRTCIEGNHSRDMRTEHTCLTAIVARERPVLPPIHTEMDGVALQAYRA